MRTERKGELASVVHVVLDHVPDDPLSGELVWFTPTLSCEDIFQVGLGPALQALLPNAPGYFKSARQFGCRKHIAIVLPLGDLSQLRATLAHEIVHPGSAGSN